MSCASCRFSSGSNLAICLNHRPLFDEHVGKYPLALYLKGNRLYISIHFKYYMFSVPDEKEELDKWTVEKAALSLKELNQEIRDTVNIFY